MTIRTFETGANRDTEEGKLDYEGFLSPDVLEAYAKYMHFNRHLRDGTMRASDNWQKGIPMDVYAKSLNRHHLEVWKLHRKINKAVEDHRPTITMKMNLIWSLAAVVFNSMGYMLELLKLHPNLMDLAVQNEEYRAAIARREDQ